MDDSYISNIIDLIGIVGTFIGLFFIWKQYKISNSQTDLMNEQNNIQKSNVKREKALEMAEYFMDLISNEIGIVNSILRGCHIEDLYKTVNYSDLRYFDKQEAERVLSKTVEQIVSLYTEEITETCEGIKKLAVVYIVVNGLEEEEVKKILLFNSLDWDIKNIDKIKGEEGNLQIEEDKIQIAKSKIDFEMDIYRKKLFTFYYKNKESLLNKLEFFSMHFTSKLADESVVYQSLHQVFLSTVKLLYGEIVYKNDVSGKDKYFTNTINLYNKWAERDEKMNKELVSKEREMPMAQKYDD